MSPIRSIFLVAAVGAALLLPVLVSHREKQSRPAAGPVGSGHGRMAELWEHTQADPADAGAADRLREAVREWLDSDAAAAVTWVLSLPPSSTRTELMAQVRYEIRTQAGTMAAADPAAAARWLRQLPEGEASEAAISQVAGAWTARDPRAAVDYLRTLHSGGEARPQAAKEIAVAWGRVQPDQAAAWVAKLPEDRTRESAVEGLVTAWAFSGSGATAGRWLEGLAAGRSRDVGLATLCDAIVQKDPAQAFRHAEGIANASMRTRQLTSAAESWYALDPAAAREGIRLSSLTPANQKRLLSKVERDG